MKMMNNVYGIIGVGSINSNWCADFDGTPKTDGNGNIKGSPYALQYCNKNLWNLRGDKVLGLREKDSKGQYYLKQSQRYTSVFGKELGKNTTNEEVLNNLLTCKDIINFGCVFTGAKGEENSIHLQGVVQIQDGLNKYADTVINTETILSPFASGDKKSMTTNGIRVTTNEAHYLYPFTITPSQLNEIGNNVGYTTEDYEDFKDVTLKSVTLYNSKAKAGCKNEFGLFVKVKEEYSYILALGDLTEYVEVYKEDGQLIYDLSRLNQVITDCKEKIESIEIYYKSNINNIKGISIEGVSIKQFDIVTGKEL
jgi:CRISPR-associated protein Csh2